MFCHPTTHCKGLAMIAFRTGFAQQVMEIHLCSTAALTTVAEKQEDPLGMNLVIDMGVRYVTKTALTAVASSRMSPTRR